MGCGWHGAVSDVVRPARLARHGHDGSGGIPFRGGADRGDLVARLLPDGCGLTFGRFVNGVDPRPRPLRDAGGLAVSQVKDPPRLPERVGVPELPGLSWIRVIVRCVTTVWVAARRVRALRRVVMCWVAVRGISPLVRVGTVTVQGSYRTEVPVPGAVGVGGAW